MIELSLVEKKASFYIPQLLTGFMVIVRVIINVGSA
jgi:hypothetical protein